MEPGAWAGATVITDENEGLFVTCSQEKWDKAKNIILKWLKSKIQTGSWKLDWKEIVGF